MQKVSPFIWFNDNAEEAVKFYVSVFKNSRIRETRRMDEEVPGPKGKVYTIAFELDGQSFMALNGGPGVYEPSGFVSFFVRCKDQREVDYFWEKLGEGSDIATQQCGWLKDKYGVTWQIVPDALGEMLSDPDPSKVKKVTQAMLKMKKINVAGLNKAYAEG